MNNTTYSTGSVSVAASGTTVTGSGTAWLSSGIRAGDLIMIAGLTAQIAAVGTNTSLTLKRAWPGAAQSGANYDIIMLDDEVRGLIAANALLQALSGGTLTSLGQIAGAANQMPYWTGTGVMGSTALTSAARSLLDDASVAAMRTTLELTLQSNDMDTTAGRVVTTRGVFPAVNALEIQSFAGDANTLAAGTRVRASLSAPGNLNMPVSGLSVWAVIETTALYNGCLRQTASVGPGSGTTSANLHRYWARLRNATDWGPWREYVTHSSLLGTVSMEGGVPSGAVIERGSNANGWYVRFADGTQICGWNASSGDLVTCSSADGPIFINSALVARNFPVSFAAPPVLTVSVARDSGGQSVWATRVAASASGAEWRVAAAVSGTIGAASYLAIGRWI